MPLVLGAIVDKEAGDGSAGGGFGEDVPLFGVPTVGGPPVAAGFPWTIGGCDAEGLFRGAKGDWLLGLELYANRDGGPDAAEGEVWMGRGFIERGWCLSGLHGDGKSLQAEAAGTVRVFKHWAADAIFAGNGLEAGDCYVEAGRLRGLRRE